MKQNPHYYLLKQKQVIFTLLLFSIISGCQRLCAQADSSCGYLPKMWVADDTSEVRENEFDAKRQLLSNSTFAERDSVPYSYAVFRNMNTYFDSTFQFGPGDRIYIYFGVYSDTGLYLPDGYAGQLMLIYRPQINNKPYGYYVVTPGINGVFMPVPDYKGKEWIDNYVKKEQLLLPALDTADQFNYDTEDSPADFSDTKYILYDYDNWHKFFVDAADCVAANGVKIDGINAYFAAFTGAGQQKGVRKHRLHVLFEFMHNGLPYSLEKSGLFKITPLANKGGDNGQLYP